MNKEIEEIYEFESEHAQTFKNKCKCGKEISVSTQKDRHPEYYTDIFVKCECGKSVKFILPVN